VAHIDDRVQPRAQKVALSRFSSFLWPHRPLRCHEGITTRDSRETPKNKIASFPALKPQKLAISKAAEPAKSTPAQRLGRFFTADKLVGTALNLRGLRDITGTYSALGVGAALAAGGGGVTQQNANGVVLHLTGSKVGVELSASVAGITISMD
jgi:hypothetical protein